MKSMGMGGSIVSRNILEKKGRLKWCIKEAPVNPVDNGWRFLSDIDTDEFLSHPDNMVVCDWGTVIELEPAVLPIFHMPEGTELTLVKMGRQLRFFHTDTGEELIFDYGL